VTSNESDKPADPKKHSKTAYPIACERCEKTSNPHDPKGSAFKIAKSEIQAIGRLRHRRPLTLLLRKSYAATTRT